MTLPQLSKLEKKRAANFRIKKCGSGKFEVFFNKFTRQQNKKWSKLKRGLD